MDNALIPEGLLKIIHMFCNGWIDSNTAQKRIDGYCKLHRIKRKRSLKIHGTPEKIRIVINARKNRKTQLQAAELIARFIDDEPLRLVQRIERQIKTVSNGGYKKRQPYEQAINKNMSPSEWLHVVSDNENEPTLMSKKEVFTMLDKRFSPENIEYLNALSKK